MPLRTKRIQAGVAAALLAGLVAWDVTRGGDSTPERTLLGWGLTLLGLGALWWRRRHPVPVAVLVLVCTAVYYPFVTRDWPVLMVAFAFMLFTLAAEGRLAAAVTLAAAAMLGVVYGEYGPGVGDRHIGNVALFLLTGWFVGLVAIGHAQRTRQAYLRETEQRALAAEREKAAAEREKAAAERERAAAEREQEVRARQAATEERLRIARELHDVLGHHISLINVQSAAALHRHARRGSTAGMVPALEAVRDTSREALRELRATLGVLRQVDEAAPTTPADLGLHRLGELTDRAGAGGLRVRTRVDVPEQPPLPPEVSLAAYRIVQESLTNIVRHAEARAATVTVTRAADGELRVRVEDDGAGMPVPSPGPGSGLHGMAERARSLGGSLAWGNITDDAGAVRGFRVEARLPAREGDAR
ncbi:sensor histidine kinase [Streptomyces sp. JJ36]|uniref:sensor histidine kinase n=1 Tax=Streptomyces sp. JJ36 TaxID=2736645 RepID=UPI001F255B81|nr:sensor histidine kinase [Streptomyces sp. JJ36]MCF6524180.1 sensor histidine kinase [Streptomyces sp. JJ36]